MKPINTSKMKPNKWYKIKVKLPKATTEGEQHFTINKGIYKP